MHLKKSPRMFKEVFKRLEIEQMRRMNIQKHALYCLYRQTTYA